MSSGPPTSDDDGECLQKIVVDQVPVLPQTQTLDAPSNAVYEIGCLSRLVQYLSPSGWPLVLII